MWNLQSQEMGTLIIDSDSSDVQIYINGKNTGLTVPFNEEVEVGVYLVEMFFTPLTSFKDSVIVTANQVTRLHENMPVVAGNLFINSIPNGASVYVGDNLVGTTPFPTNEISTGNYEFTLKKESYNDARLKVVVRGDTVNKELVELTAGYGTISILANPEADIYIDDNFEGTRMFNGRLNSGTHVIEARKPSHETQAKIIVVEEGKAYRELFELRPMYGKISVITHPHFANIYVDGELVGKSPKVLEDVFVGDYILKLEKEGYAPIEKKVTVEDGLTTYLSEELKNGIKIVAVPDSAEIYINGEFAGLSPQFISDLKTGIYKIQFKKEGFPTFTKEVKYTANTTIDILEKLQPGYLISTDPGEAKIYIDGALAGTTPKIFSNLVDTHLVEIKKDGYADISKTIVFEKDSSANIHENLTPGVNITLTANAPDAQIWVDDEFIGVGMVDLALAKGEHKVVCKNSQYFNNLEQTITAIENGQSEMLEMSRKFCSVTIRSTPKKATAYLDGVKLLVTNDSAPALGGKYNLKLEARNFKPINEEISIEDAYETFEYTLMPKRYRSKGLAVLLTTVFPGSGRAYLTRG